MVRYQMTQKNDYKFAAGVKQSVFRLAGGRCAFKDCAKHLTSDKNNCQIAHIYPAKDNGPRSIYIKEHGIDGSFRESEKNGILMCPDHASLIDKDDGKGYPPATLFDWKDVIELTNELIAHNPKIQRYEQEISVHKIISVVRDEYDASKKNRAIQLNNAIEKKLNHFYNEKIANKHKISELECKQNPLTSEVKQLINEKKEAERINSEINFRATYNLLEMLKNQAPQKNTTEETRFLLKNRRLDMIISLNGKSFKFSGVNYEAEFTKKNLKSFEIKPHFPFLDMRLSIKNSKLEKIECDVTNNLRLTTDRQNELGFFKRTNNNFTSFCELLESSQSLKETKGATFTFQFAYTDLSTTFISNLNSRIEAPDQFLKAMNTMLLFVNKGYSHLFHNETCNRLLDGRLTKEEFSKIYDFFYRKPEHEDEEQFEFENYNCEINKSIFGQDDHKRLKIREISSEKQNTSNSENSKPMLLIEL